MCPVGCGMNQGQGVYSGGIVFPGRQIGKTVDVSRVKAECNGSYECGVNLQTEAAGKSTGRVSRVD